MNKNIFIIIPVHNRREYTKGCLRSLGEQLGVNFKIIVVDDGSTDGTGEMIRQEFPDTVILKGDGSLFWTAAINMGVRYALERNADYIITLNDDTETPPGFIQTLFNASEAHSGSLVGAAAVDIGTGRWLYGGERMDWLRAKSVKLLDLLPPGQRTGLHEVTHFPGRGLLVPASVYKEIGLYDQKHFPHAVADNDFTLRAARSGHKIYCNYDVKLLCYTEESFGSKMTRNPSLPNFMNQLFHIKGGGNLKYFWFFALHNCPRRYLVTYLFIGFMRRILGYWVHAFRNGLFGKLKRVA